MARKVEIDFTTGPLLKNILIYALPIVGVNILQLLFTAADVAVLGIFTNDHAVAAVGAATPIVNLLIGFFVGFSVGINVLLARCVGAKDKNMARRVVGTSLFISIFFGTILLIAGELLAEQLLLWTNCDPSVLPYAATYLRIYFLGMPIVMLYNFSTSILRAVGDTFRPLIFLIIAGCVNVSLNVFFVTVLNYDIEGVAIATVSSNAISAICACALILKTEGYAKFEFKYFKIHKTEFYEIIKIGFPLAIAKCLISFANVMVQSNLNALGDIAMTAHSITKEIDGLILEAIHGFGTANLAVISQNYGAKNMQRVKQSAIASFILMSSVSLVLGGILLIFGYSLCSIMTDTEVVLEYCMVRITTVSITYIFLGFLSVIQEVIRGIGYSFTSLMLSVCANLILRIIYMCFVYPFLCIKDNIAHNLRMLYILYPASWIISCIIGFFIMIYLYRKVKMRFEREKQQEMLTEN